MCPITPVPSSMLTMKAPAKINLSLRILSRRPDGYHNLRSFMQKLDLFDVVRVTRTEWPGISCRCRGRKIPGQGKNIALLAAEKFQQITMMAGGIAIDLEKNIPVAAGLGGGSSDAATVLLALNRLCGAPLSDDELSRMGLSLGADVPFFLLPEPAAWAEGVGEQLKPSPSIAGHHILLVNPGFHLSTRWVFENFQLTSEVMKGKKNNFPDCIDDIPLVNDLAAVTMSRYPVLKVLAQEMHACGARTVLMSGSGPTMFALFSLEKEESCVSGLATFTRRYGVENVFMCQALA